MVELHISRVSSRLGREGDELWIWACVPEEIFEDESEEEEYGKLAQHEALCEGRLESEYVVGHCVQVLSHH